MFKKLAYTVCIASSLITASMAQTVPAVPLTPASPLSQPQVEFLLDMSSALLHADKKTGETLLPVLKQRAQEMGVGHLFATSRNLKAMPERCQMALDGFKPLFSQAVDALKTKDLPASTTVLVATEIFNVALMGATSAVSSPIYNGECTDAVATGLSGAAALQFAIPIFMSAR